MKARIVQGAPCLTRVEHRADIRKRQISWNAGDEHVELFVGRARVSEKSAQLHLSNGDANAAFGQVCLHQLLECVVTAADGEKIDGELLAVVAPYSPRSARPTGSFKE